MRHKLARLCGGLLLLVAAGWFAATLLAGPLETRALKMPSDAKKAPDAPSDEHAFFYQQGKKVYLRDTGLAVVKLKEGVNVDSPDLPFRPLALAPNDPLASVRDAVEKRRMIVVSTHGPAAASIQNPPADQAKTVEFALPVVERSDAPPQQTAPLIMTEKIGARFARGTTKADVEEYIKPMGLKIARKQEYEPDGYVLELSEGPVTYARLLRAANKLYEKGKDDKKILYSSPDFIVPTKRHQAKGAQALPQDPLLDQQWHLENTGQGQGKVGADVKAKKAWEMTLGNPAVRIAIIDDSVQANHPDLAPNFVAGLYLKPDGGTTNDPSPKSGDQRHGTCCAGVAVAASNNVGGCGVAPRCGLIGVNFWDAETPSRLADAFYFCDQQRASVISCSWSWDFAFDSVSIAIRDLYQNGRGGKGTVILFAAGNDYSSITSKQKFGTMPEVICVGATNWRDDHAVYSNRGSELCVSAPSSDYYDTPGSFGILTTDNTDGMPRPAGRTFSGYAVGDYTPGNHDAAAFGGTSSATPLVAGVCGLMLSVNPDLTAKQVREVLQATADKIPGGSNHVAQYGADGHDDYYGHGRVNAYEAVKRARAMLASTP